jgi:hypothetical protein
VPPFLGLCYDVTLAKGGLDLAVQGYCHKLPVLMSKIVEEMQRFASDPAACSTDLFARMKQKSLRNLKNYLFWQPYYHCMIGSLLCLEDGRFSSAEKFRALEGATHADFYSFVSALVKTLRAQVLVHGNLTADDATKLTALITEKLPFKALPLSQVSVRRVVAVPEGASYIYRQHAAQTNPNEINSAAENIYLVGLSDGAQQGGVLPAASSPAVVNEAALELLAHMVSGCTETLVTSVCCYSFATINILGWCSTVWTPISDGCVNACYPFASRCRSPPSTSYARRNSSATSSSPA